MTRGQAALNPKRGWGQSVLTSKMNRLLFSGILRDVYKSTLELRLGGNISKMNISKNFGGKNMWDIFDIDYLYFLHWLGRTLPGWIKRETRNLNSVSAAIELQKENLFSWTLPGSQIWGFICIMVRLKFKGLANYHVYFVRYIIDLNIFLFVTVHTLILRHILISRH